MSSGPQQVERPVSPVLTWPYGHVLRPTLAATLQVGGAHLVLDLARYLIAGPGFGRGGPQRPGPQAHRSSLLVPGRASPIIGGGLLGVGSDQPATA